ncbi:MAG: DEAD/DEAH box helicase [Proteobacteria bacterium]|nr:DEAD/DEAH box helicase [Pseudomonadota bacterium]
MILRKRQQEFVSRSVTALKEHGNTLGVAPTGAGKTLMFSAVVGEFLGKQSKALILAHRDELTSQNQEKFLRINPNVSTSVFDAKTKSFAGQAVFAMVQTLSRKENLSLIPAIDILAIDEGHHSVSPSYRNIIKEVKEKNPEVKIYGVTATPSRGDKKDLGDIFSNVADQIKISELVASGHLVRPRTYIIDVGTQSELKKVKKTAGDFDMAAVEKIMNKLPITEEVFAKWQELAGNRKTVIFCSTVVHAKSVAGVFNAHAVKTVFISGDLSDSERKNVLAEFEQGDAQVIVNVAVLTEGWDYQPTSCVVLLRPSSFKSTMIQMIGRGLRVVDSDLYPEVVKEDCIILDFGTSSLIHGSLEVDVDLEKAQQPKKKSESAFQKECPSCSMLVPSASNSCPLCDYEFAARDEVDPLIGELSGFIMSEIDLLTQRSNFEWCDIFGDGAALMASGFNAFAGIFFLNDHWYAIGGTEFGIKILSFGSQEICLAQADDFLNENETADNAHKSKSWLKQTASTRQLQCLPFAYRNDYSITKYKAANLLKFYFNKTSIQKLLFEADAKRHVASVMGGNA